MQKKGFIAVLSAIVAMIVLSVSLVFTIGPKVSASHIEGQTLVFDSWDDFEIDETGVLIGLSSAAWNELYNYGSIGCGNFFLNTDEISAIQVSIPDGVKSIGDGAFYGLTVLTDVTIPVGVESIGNSAFMCCGLTNVIIPDGVTNIDERAFFSCYYLTNITIPDSVNNIGKEAFCRCESLESVIIPAGVLSIGKCAFQYCSNLTDVTIPDSVAKIDFEAFADCYRLTSIVLPDITSMDRYVFYNCSNLITIYCETTNPAPNAQPAGWTSDWKSGCDATVVWDYVQTYTVTFNVDGIDDQIVNKNNYAVAPATPTKAGYVFKGWFIGDDEYDFDTPVTGDITLTAQWEAIPEPEPSNPEQPTTPDNPEQPTTPDTDTETVTAGSKNGFNIGAAIGSGLVAGLGSISAIAATVIVRRRHK
ncbi:MAG: leucine-rich repeat protein [Clostridia bacterium]|nr:leucine-rich repeat protein [Clostridia bacterium]